MTFVKGSGREINPMERMTANRVFDFFFKTQANEMFMSKIEEI